VGRKRKVNGMFAPRPALVDMAHKTIEADAFGEAGFGT